MVEQRASLLPYLQPAEGSRSLRLELLAAGGPGADRCCPFRVLADFPYCSVLEGSLQSDAGYDLRRVLLLVEKDRYGASPAERLRPVTNPEIERAWRAAGTAPEGEGGAVLLSSQTGSDGDLVRQASLFYCRQRSLFFHPVCPSCGLELSLCTDDDFLKSAGLSPYTTSAKRYLYCRDCCVLGPKEIYLYERDHGDPAWLGDRWSLIDRLGAVDEVMATDGAFPCVGCPERAVCFGPHGVVRNRMVPLSFYPFHLLILDAPSLHAADFLALAAGASPKELEELLDPLTDEARITRLQALGDEGSASLFPPADPRSFREVLFLKLSFLEGVLRLALTQPGPMGLASDAAWVRLAPLGRGLPLFWNFSVQILEGVIPAGPRRLGGEDRVQLGLFWFQALVSNRKVSGPELLQAVADHVASAQEQGERRGDALWTFLAPENLFWRPEGRTVPVDVLPLWARACALGLELAGGSAAPTPLPRLIESCSSLIRSVKDGLGHSNVTAPGPGMPAASAILEREPMGALLREVVAGLTEPYRAETPSAGERAPEPEEFEAATVVIGQQQHPGRPGQQSVEALTETVLQGGAPFGNEDMTETVLLSPTVVRSGGRAPEPPGSEDMTETVLFTPMAVGSWGGVPEPPGDDVDILETVLIPAQRPKTERAGVLLHDDEPVLETVLLAPPGPLATPPQPSVGGDENGGEKPDLADEVGETVMITPPPRGFRR